MYNYNQTYNEISDNLTIANQYNIKFKEEMDESLYKMVVGYVTFENSAEEELLKSPHAMLSDLESDFTRLKNVTTDSESKVWLETLLRNTDILKDRVTDIVESIRVGGNYDQNIRELDENIYILTELIQEDIQYYIYYQMHNMQEVTTALKHQVRLFIILCTLLMVVLALGLIFTTLLITSGILRPVQELYEATGEIAKGNFDVRARVTSQDEIAVLSEGFNNMAGNIQTLVDRVRENEQKMRRTDLRLLQEQINPHFLYNTLDTIVWLIEGNEPEEAVDMVVTLSDFFRIVLSKGKEFISIRQEAQHIESYLQIQGKRYHDIMEYVIDIAPELYDFKILKLTLQPLVENALYHGIKYKRSKGNILVSGYLSDKNIILSVYDDGVGMDEEELGHLREEIERPCKETEKGFGLANVNERIHMYFGSEYGMSIEAQKGWGTKVQIVIPAIEARENDVSLDGEAIWKEAGQDAGNLVEA